MANLLAQAMSKQVVLENKPTSWRLESSWRLVNKHFASFRSYLLALLHIFSFLFNYVLWWLNVKKKKTDSTIYLSFTWLSPSSIRNLPFLGCLGLGYIFFSFLPILPWELDLILEKSFQYEVSKTNFFKLGFTPFKAPLQGLELQEKEAQKD